MVEHLTADQEVPGSIRVPPLAMADSGKTKVLTSRQLFLILSN